MHIVTFYSFKGGTGRSMALANVAAELSSRGRRVLIVDFDLEAPGLDTFPFGSAFDSSAGVIDLVHDYISSDVVPDVLGYLRDVTLTDKPGKLWLMPSGRQDRGYDAKFRTIDWNSFYENQDGFLFFEDLKIQWKEALAPDYVLVDSRTGHTDIGGICTRQLPDAVVIMFFPNDQNLRGLIPVVEDIRSESEREPGKTIKLDFVMSNVPDIADEAEILSTATQKFKQALGFKHLAATIHHFSSLSMLEQKLFVIDRARSRLAGEYRELVDTIIRGNDADSEGAVMFLDEAVATLRVDRAAISLPALEEKLKRLKSMHPGNVEVLRRLARIRRLQRRTAEAMSLLDQIVQLGGADAGVLIGRAEILAHMNKNDLAARDLSQVFLMRNVSAIDLAVAVRLKIEIDPNGLREIIGAPALFELGDDAAAQVAQEFERDVDTLSIGRSVLEAWIEHNGPGLAVNSYHELILLLIGLGDFSEAKKRIRDNVVRAQEWSIYDSFNFAICEWGLKGQVPIYNFEQILPLFERLVLRSPNGWQCLALTRWALGDLDGAKLASERAAQAIQGARDSSFSAWSFLLVSADRFLLDLSEMEEMFAGLRAAPAVLSRRDTDDGMLRQTQG